MTFPPQALPSSIAPPEVIAPAENVFGRRAARLRALAPGHAMSSWLSWLADLSDQQQAQLEQRAAETSAPPSAWREIYRALCEGMGLEASADESGLQSRAANCLAMAQGTGAGAGRDQTDILVAAAMQVARTRAARQQCAQAMPTITDLDHCPCCGSAPVGGVLMAGDGRGGLRYLECALCATRWHRVRAHCCLCDSDAAVEYLGIEGSKGEVQAEACPACSGYIKLFFEARAPGIDPVADDLATLVLDVLVGEDGFARGAPNLFLVAGESV